MIFEQPPGDIGVLPMEGERTVEMLLDGEFQESSPALSPDGRWLAYMSNETGEPLIYVQPFPNIDEGQWRGSPANGVFPMWSPDGRELFYWTSTGNLMVAPVETEPTFSARTPEPLFSVTSPQAFDFGGRQLDLVPDGDRVVVRKFWTAAQTSGDTFVGMIVVENWHQELLERVPIP